MDCLKQLEFGQYGELTADRSKMASFKETIGISLEEWLLSVYHEYLKEQSIVAQLQTGAGRSAPAADQGGVGTQAALRSSVVRGRPPPLPTTAPGSAKSRPVSSRYARKLHQTTSLYFLQL